MTPFSVLVETEFYAAVILKHINENVGEIQMTVFWDVASCSLVVANSSEVLAASEMSVNFYQTTW
jgi:hypothetical protein